MIAWVATDATAQLIYWKTVQRKHLSRMMNDGFRLEVTEMRLIDADDLINNLVIACDNDQSKFLPVWIEKQIEAQPTIPYDQKWEPDCEDCRPEDIRECIICRQR